MDLISVVIPVYNGAKTIECAIMSILNQKSVNLECIIVDDCSTDATSEIVRRLIDQDSRIRYFKNCENKGLAFSVNRGISAAKGCFLARQDADDCSHPLRLKIQLDILRTQKDLDLIFTDSLRSDESFKNLPNRISVDVLKGRLGSNNFVHGTMFCSADIKSDLVYNQKIRFGQDFALWKNLVDKDRTLSIIRFPLYQYSFDSISTSKFIYQAKNAFDIQNKIWLSKLLFSRYLILPTRISIRLHILFNEKKNPLWILLSKLFWPYYTIFLPRNQWTRRSFELSSKKNI